MSESLEVLWNALLTAIVVSLLAGLFIAAMPPVFRATATVDGSPEDMLMIQSADLLEEVIAAGELESRHLEGWYEAWVDQSGDPLALLRSKLNVSAGRFEGWIDISVEAADPVSAAAATNAVARTYLNRKATRQLTVEEKSRLLQKVAAAESALSAYIDANPLAARANAEIVRLDREAESLLRERASLSEKLEVIRGQRQQLERGEVMGLTEPNLLRAAGRLETLELALEELRTRYGTRHQEMVAKLAEVTAARHQLEVLRNQLLENLAEQQSAGAQEHDELEERISGNQSLRLALIRQQSALADLERELEIAREGYGDIAEQAFEPVFAEAIPGVHALGIGQAGLLGGVFSLTFVLAWLLLRWDARRS